MGGGRGMGRGMGCGKGMGMGGGKGMGMGGGRIGASGRKASRDWEAEPWEGTDVGEDQENLSFLKQQAKTLSERLGKIQERIEQMEKK
jgi:hypothetical protein